MRKEVMVLLVVGFLVTMMGCARQGAVGPEQTPFIGGETALSLSFIEGAPPDEIFDNSGYPFAVILQVENLGEDDVEEDGYIEITGINPEDFIEGGVQDDLKKDLPEINGARKNAEGVVFSGDKASVEVPGLNYIPDVHGNFDGPIIRAEACYNYKTQTSTQICVKGDLLTPSTGGICEVSGDKFPQSSGGPIHITGLKEEPVGENKVQVSFVVEHVGEINDRFYKLDTDCRDSPTNRDRDKVKITVTSDVGESTKCSGLEEASADGKEGYVTLWGRSPRTVVCTIDVGDIGSSVYQALFTVDLDYRYHQFIEKPVLVKDVSDVNEE